LATNCYKCHGEEKQKGDLRLDSLTAILAGGESGPAVVVGKPEESLLVEAIRHESFEMPPEGKLKDNEILALTSWIKSGAPWPGDHGRGAVPTKREKITDEDRAFWSFQPIQNPRGAGSSERYLVAQRHSIASSSSACSANNSSPRRKPRRRCSCGDCTSI
jgi:hypothetical protein